MFDSEPAGHFGTDSVEHRQRRLTRRQTPDTVVM